MISARANAWTVVFDRGKTVSLGAYDTNTVKWGWHEKQ